MPFPSNNGSRLLLQQNRRSVHEGDPPPVPDHDDEDAGRQERLHGKPHLGEASVLVDALQANPRCRLLLASISPCYSGMQKGAKVCLQQVGCL